MGRVVHFEIAADDMKRAVEFYKEVFGWDIKKWDGPIEYWLTTTGDNDKPGINGGILPRDPNYPGVMNTIAVESVDKAVIVIEKMAEKLLLQRHLYLEWVGLLILLIQKGMCKVSWRMIQKQNEDTGLIDNSIFRFPKTPFRLNFCPQFLIEIVILNPILA